MRDIRFIAPYTAIPVLCSCCKIFYSSVWICVFSTFFPLHFTLFIHAHNDYGLKGFFVDFRVVYVHSIKMGCMQVDANLHYHLKVQRVCVKC